MLTVGNRIKTCPRIKAEIFQHVLKSVIIPACAAQLCKLDCTKQDLEEVVQVTNHLWAAEVLTVIKGLSEGAP